MTEEKPSGNSTGKGCTTIGGVVCLGLLLGALKFMGCLPEDFATPIDRSPKERLSKEIAEADAVQISAETLTHDYQANEVAADKQYKGKILEVTGRITQIHAGSSGPFGSRPFVQLRGVRCEFNDNGQIEHLVTGGVVTIRGKCQGEAVIRYCAVRG